MGEHRALRLAGRPAREDDLGERVGGHGGRRRGSARRARSGSDLDPDDGQPERPGRGLGLAAGEDEPGAGLVDDLAAELDGVADVERHGHAAEVGDGEKARPHSGRLTAQMMARSPGSRPAAGRTARRAARSPPRSRYRQVRVRKDGRMSSAGRRSNRSPPAGPGPPGSTGSGVCRVGLPAARAPVARSRRTSLAPSVDGGKWLKTMVSTSRSASRRTLHAAAWSSL